MSSTPRFSLPFLDPGQAQKEFAHNEALQILDILLCAVAEDVGQTTPPASPAAGACYLLGDSPLGAWEGHAQSIAAWTSGGWRFVAPQEGAAVYIKSTGNWATYRLGGWEIGVVRGSRVLIGGQQVVGGRAAAISSPSGGATVDSQARSTIDEMLAALRTHGLIAS